MSTSVLTTLRSRAEGVLLITKQKDGTEIVFCGDQDGEYEGWRERAYADSKGWTYQADGDEATAAILEATDLAWAAIGANYDTTGADIIGKQPLWEALGNLEAALRKIGYIATEPEPTASPVFELDPDVCTHPREVWKYIRTREDWIDGDEDDIYECQSCGKRIEEYIPR